MLGRKDEFKAIGHGRQIPPRPARNVRRVIVQNHSKMRSRRIMPVGHLQKLDKLPAAVAVAHDPQYFPTQQVDPGQ
jgi:hypothetical protein